MLTVSQIIPSLSLSGNAMRIAITSDNVIDSATGNRRAFYTILLRVLLNGEELWVDSVEPDENGVSQFDIQSVVDAAIKPTLQYPFPAGIVSQDTGAVGTLTFQIAEGFGIPFTISAYSNVSGTFLVIPGGCSDWYLKQLEAANSSFAQQIQSSNMFLTNSPKRRIASDTLLIVRCINGTAGSSTVTLKGNKTLADGTTEEVILWTGTMLAGKLYDFDISPAHFTNAVAYTVLLNDFNDNPLTQTLSFEVITENLLQSRSIIFRNSLGGWDTITATGQFIGELDLQRTVFNTPVVSRFRNALETGSDRALGIRYLKGNIGFMSNEELEWMQELALSEEVYMVTERGLEKVVLQTDKVVISSDDIGPKSMAIEAIVGISDFFFQS
ncbi:MAG TPA: hypothetical protein VMW01_16540 [Williamwhitmania sp.]|nr:hypothetical protein [Williamwhitmania sp.]